MEMGGLTQAEAAKRAGVSDTTWTQIERGQPVSERSLAKISQALWGNPRAGADILAGKAAPEAPPPETPRDDLVQVVLDLTEEVRRLREEIRARPEGR